MYYGLHIDKYTQLKLKEDTDVLSALSLFSAFATIDHTVLLSRLRDMCEIYDKELFWIIFLFYLIDSKESKFNELYMI